MYAWASALVVEVLIGWWSLLVFHVTCFATIASCHRPRAAYLMYGRCI